ncbi:MAG TPA: ATP-binding protein [Gemmatimonadaceae bacterium]|nr:ATP-binding protein [Gemmatimonadaceae bacterium]
MTRLAPSLRTELLVTTAILAAAAVLVAAVGVVLLPSPTDATRGALYLGALVAADVGIFVAFGAYQLRRLVTRPLRAAVEATEAIAAGDLTRRLPAGATSEFAALSASVNRMTDNLLDEQGQRLRAEKLATVGRLAAGIAHEVGNPLGAIDGYAHILRARANRRDGASSDDPTVRDALDGIERESGRIDRIVRGLLEYASPRRLTPARVDVNDVLRGAVDLLGHQGVLRRLSVDVALGDDGAPLALDAQRHELEQVFVNVLLNAADALDGGNGGRLAVRTRRVSPRDLLARDARRAGDPFDAIPVARRESPRVRAWLERAGQLGDDAPRADLAQIVIADSGSGVAEEDAERIFDPFYTTKEPGRGTGLGLAIVARVVEGLRGAVWVQRAREGGAAFVIVLPLAESAAPVPATLAAPPVVPASAVPSLGSGRRARPSLTPR